MNRLVIIFSAVCVIALAGPLAASVLDQVLIGDPVWEAGHSLVGWGDVQFGDLHDPPGPYGAVDLCRGIDCPVALGDGDNWAEITLDFGPNPASWGRCLQMRHLEGQAVDAFELYIGATLIYSYPGDLANTDLVWHIATVEWVEASGPTVLHLVSTGEHWSGWETYGQMYFDWFILSDACGSPVAETTWSTVKALFR